MNQDVLERILQCQTLPSLPAVAIRILELTSDLNVSIAELARTIENDQGLTAKILRTVNSSFYGLRKPCPTIHQAVVILGLSAVKSLVLGFSLVTSIKGVETDCAGYTTYWRRALYTAVSAKAIARAARLKFEDEAFVAGLLQDIGMVAMHQALGEEYVAILRQAGSDHSRLAQIELAALEAHHPDVGAMLAQRWRLPPELVVSIKYHELPTAAPQDHAPLVRCVALGNAAHDCLTESGPDEAAGAVARFHSRALDWFGLSAAIADELLISISDAIHKAGDLFSLNTGPYPDAYAILAAAQTRLSELASIQQAVAAEGHLSGLLSDSDQRDPLTGALAPGAFNALAESAFKNARVTGAPVSLLILTLDHFDRLTAAGGRSASDAALVETAALLEAQTSARAGSVARIDASTFAILLPGLDRAQATRVASELRTALESQSTAWKLPNLQPIPITASVGAAAICPSEGPTFTRANQLFIAARRAAEAATLTGGNTVRAFQPKIAA